MIKYVSLINPASSALMFIDNRLSFDNYRGIESSQHNRYNSDDLYHILSILNNHTCSKGVLRIRTTDTSKRPFNLEEEIPYAQFCDEAKKVTGIGTQDAMRKNLFVDWHRMGFINRFDRNMNFIEPYQRSSIWYVSLTTLGQRFINETNQLERQFLFSKGLDNLLSGFIETTLNLLSDYSLKSIDFYEFMFFVTAINAPNYGISISECADLILDYRRLTRIQKSSVLDVLNSQLNPNLFQGNKLNKRDFHNWKNKNQQIWYLFDSVVFFNIEKGQSTETLKLVDSSNASSYGRKKMQRSNRAKTDYFQLHGIKKTLGYELDHIIPLMAATNISEFHYLDTWKNLLYIDGKTHAVKTQSGSKFCVLRIQDNDYQNLLLFDYQNNYLPIRHGIEGLFNPDNIPMMLGYNSDFLEQVQ